MTTATATAASGETPTETQPRSGRPEADSPRRRAGGRAADRARERDLRLPRHAAPHRRAVFEGIIATPQTFRGRALRLNLGRRGVELTVNGKRCRRAGPRAGGLRVHPARADRPLPLGTAPARERTGGHRRHRHRGADRAGTRPQRAVALGPAARNGHRARAHHDLRRPARGHGRAAALPGRPGRGPDRHQRGPRARPPTT